MSVNSLNREYGKWLNTMPWDYFTTLSFKWDVKAKQCRSVMDNLTKELVDSKRDFGMFWVAEWHKSGTSTHTHLLLKGEVTDLVDYYWKSNNYGDNRGIRTSRRDRCLSVLERNARFRDIRYGGRGNGPRIGKKNIP